MMSQRIFETSKKQFSAILNEIKHKYKVNVFQEKWTSNGDKIFVGVFNDDVSRANNEPFLIEGQGKQWLLHNVVKTESLEQQKSVAGQYTIQIIGSNQKNVEAIENELSQGLNIPNLALNRNRLIATRAPIENVFLVLLSVALATLTMCMWFDYLATSREKALKLLFGFSKMQIFKETILKSIKALVISTVIITGITVTYSVIRFSIIYPLLWVWLSAMALVLLTTIISIVGFGLLLVMSKFSPSQIKRNDQAQILNGASLVGKVVVTFILLILAQNVLAETLDVLKAMPYQQSIIKYKQARFITPLSSHTGPGTDYSLDETNRKVKLKHIRQMNVYFQNLFRENDLMILEASDAVAQMNYHPETTKFSIRELENEITVSSNYLTMTPIYDLEGDRVKISATEKDMIELVPSAYTREIHQLKKVVDDDNQMRQNADADNELRDSPGFFAQKIRFIYIQTPHPKYVYLPQTVVRHPLIRVLTPSNMRKNVSEYPSDVTGNSNNYMFTNKNGSATKLVKRIGLQPYFQGPMPIEERLNSVNSDEILFVGLCSIALVIMVSLYYFFSALFLRSHLEYSRRTLQLAIIFGGNRTKMALNYVWPNIVVILIIAGYNWYHNSWLFGYYLGFAGLEFIITFIVYSIAIKKMTRGLR
ncbi:hypothetical protein EQG49_00855 [Periweissella cryptocerci]|uniref:DUF1430 domain-containing protein n=2 Tax=Periweissella cryptocerci TaxID=2506420 RepID=A0A4P6YR83_9LACO|nr:hypothetical protein EQG49_00855 [Periweissella cryptocerci]